jgi:hypothetical protein
MPRLAFEKKGLGWQHKWLHCQQADTRWTIICCSCILTRIFRAIKLPADASAVGIKCQHPWATVQMCQAALGLTMHAAAAAAAAVV